MTLFNFRKSVTLLEGLIDLPLFKGVRKIGKANISFVLSVCLSVCGPGSVVGIATDYGLEGPGIEYRWGEIFRTCSDRP